MSRLISAVVLLFALWSLPVIAQEVLPTIEQQPETVSPSEAEAPLGLSTPGQTIQTYLDAYEGLRDASTLTLRKAAIQSAEACFDSEGVTGLAITPDLIRKFGDVLEGTAVEIPYVPGQQNIVMAPFIRQDPSGRVATYQPPKLAELDLNIQLSRSAEGAWRFTPETAENVSSLYTAVFPDRGLAGLYRRLGLGILVDNSLLSVAYFQWISLFVLILSGVMIDFFFRHVTTLISRRFLKKEDDRKTPHDTKQLILRVARPVGMLAGATSVYFTITLLDLPATAEAILRIAANVFATLAAVWAAYRFVDLIGEFIERKAEKTTSKIDDLLVPLIRKALKLFVTAIGIVYVANSLDIEILPLLTGLGIGGLAFAFAAKDTIENFFGSIAVIADRPFEVGDWVNIDGVDGTVEEIGLRSTRIRTFYNSLVTVPNSTLVRARVDNYGRRQYRRYKSTLTVTYATPPDRLETFCAGVRELVRKHPYTRKDFFLVEVNDLGAHSVDILLYMFFRCPDWATELRERHRFILDVLRLADHLGVDFAFPTQTLHLINDTDTPMNQKSSISREIEQSLRDAGEAAAHSIIEGAEIQEGRPVPARGN
ncbi:MAG: mechanosensitive ion channel family protein [Planctomycetota bacterium]